MYIYTHTHTNMTHLFVRHDIFHWLLNAGRSRHHLSCESNSFSRYKFSKLSPPLNTFNKITIKLTFQKFNLHFDQ